MVLQYNYCFNNKIVSLTKGYLQQEKPPNVLKRLTESINLEIIFYISLSWLDTKEYLEGTSKLNI